MVNHDTMADKRKRRKLASGHEVINDGEDFNDDRQNEKKTRSKIIDLKNLDIHESDEDNEDDDDFDDVGNNIGYRKRRENYEPQENSAEDDENGSDDEDGDDIDNLDAIGEGNEDDEEDKNDDVYFCETRFPTFMQSTYRLLKRQLPKLFKAL